MSCDILLALDNIAISAVLVEAGLQCQEFPRMKSCWLRMRLVLKKLYITRNTA